MNWKENIDPLECERNLKSPQELEKKNCRRCGRTRGLDHKKTQVRVIQLRRKNKAVAKR